MRRALTVALGLLAGPVAAQEEAAPLSAIDWLSQSVQVPSRTGAPLAEPPVAADASAPGITVTSLDGAEGGASGVLPPTVTGLPRDLWSRSDGATLVPLILATNAEDSPALRDLLVTLLLAEAEPPAVGGGREFLLVRIDKLLDLGALEAAAELLQSQDLLEPDLFRRWFDVSLLTGTENEACALLETHPSLAPTLMARVFCFARNGDWNAAALTLNTAQALGDVSSEDELLLARFLDPEFEAEEPVAQPPTRPSPLTYRMREAVGDLMPTTGLPLAFSHADLRDTVAWRVQLEAAERLSRRGVLSPNVLLAVYTARTPAASGGVWDRAEAIQRLDRALGEGDAAAAAEALPRAWSAMEEVGLAVPFARLFGEALLGLELPETAAGLAYRIALLSPAYEAAAQARLPGSPREEVWHAIATGEIDGVAAPDAPSAAVLAGFQEPPPAEVAADLSEGRTGEAILRAIQAFQRGRDGDHLAITEAIATLIAAGQDDAARQAALQYLIVDARS